MFTIIEYVPNDRTKCNVWTNVTYVKNEKMREIDMAFILKIGFIWSEVAICVIGFVWSEVAICVLKPLFILIKFETEIKTRFELSALQRKTNLNYAKIVLLLQMSQLF